MGVEAIPELLWCILETHSSYQIEARWLVRSRGKVGGLKNHCSHSHFTLDLYVPVGITGSHLQTMLIPCRCLFSLSPVIHFSSPALSALSHSPSDNHSSPFLWPLSLQWFTPSPSSRPQSAPPISSCTYIFILAQQQVLECLFKCGVAQCVTSWVDGRVDITQPVANNPHSVGDTRLAEGWDQHHDVIRRPCDDESQQDGKDGLGHL